ncbi:unnamed protein product [Medioppia subpectinata]|uniref:Uncharacterized protein n=1 Tax=Medioppia subpectinata TaxID=1979941 RepID=A0A7R9PTR9_9ACAR|nr:unnamed protein product [Medioppia subpectinata]CAG2100026.1 unnamed protein product [Medioppia subpectinata]
MEKVKNIRREVEVHLSLDHQNILQIMLEVEICGFMLRIIGINFHEKFQKKVLPVLHFNSVVPLDTCIQTILFTEILNRKIFLLDVMDQSRLQTLVGVYITEIPADKPFAGL